MMSRMAARGTKIVVNLIMEAQTLPPAVSRNTVAEIRGSVYPEQVSCVSLYCIGHTLYLTLVQRGGVFPNAHLYVCSLQGYKEGPTQHFQSLLIANERDLVHLAQVRYIFCKRIIHFKLPKRKCTDYVYTRLLLFCMLYILWCTHSWLMECWALFCIC